MTKERLLTGDRPTGKLHLGHYVGSICNRLKYQNDYDCLFFIADLHMLTTKKRKEDIIASRNFTKEAMIDYLSCGLDPKKITFYLQSALPAISELYLIFSMLMGINRLYDLPSIKEMAKNAHLDMEAIPLGLLGYPILQAADILIAKAHSVPVGRENEPHIELARDVARRFNQNYGDYFPEPQVMRGEAAALIGIDGKGKMSKSANNAIFLSDSREEVEKKVRSMYTDPNRIHQNVPGTVEGNPVFIYLDIFDKDKALIDGFKERYRAGTVGDVEVKDRLCTVLNEFLDPIREKRKDVAKEKGFVESILYEGTCKMREETDKTMKEIKSLMGLSGTWNKISREGRDYLKRGL